MRKLTALLFLIASACVTSTNRPPQRGGEPGPVLSFQPFAGRWAMFADDAGNERSWIGGAQQPLPGVHEMTLSRLRQAVASQFGLRLDELSEAILTVREGRGWQVEFQQRTGSDDIVDAGILLHFDAGGRLAYLRETFLQEVLVPEKPSVPSEPGSFLEAASAGVLPSEQGALQVLEVSGPFLIAADNRAQWAVRGTLKLVPHDESIPLFYDIVVTLPDGGLLMLIDHNHPQTVLEANVFRPTPLRSCTSEEYVAVAPAPRYERVILQRLSGGATVAQGSYATPVDLDKKPNQAWSACNAMGICDFHFQWYPAGSLEQQKFGEVMAYLHIDAVQDHVQSLRLTLANRPIRFDVIAKTGGNVAYYQNVPVGKGDLFFGEFRGHGVATDGKVIVHEYAHALQAAEVGAKLSKNVELLGVSEGFADYLAVSFFSATESRECRPCIAAFMNGGSCYRSLLDAQTYPPKINPKSRYEYGLTWARALFRALRTVRRAEGSWDAARRIVDYGAFLGHEEVQGKSKPKIANMRSMAVATLGAVRANTVTAPYFAAFCDGFEKQTIVKAGTCTAIRTLPVVVQPLPP